MRTVQHFIYVSVMASLLSACAHPIHDPTIKAEVTQETKVLTQTEPDLNPKVLRLALEAYYVARQQGRDPQGELAIIDFSKPSTVKRLWVMNVETNEPQFKTWVAHGEGSGGIQPNQFSNKDNTKASSIGLFEAGQAYSGHLGYALHLKGLDKGFNDHAYSRHIVMHGAPYVSAAFIQHHGRLGRSWGCPAIDTHLIKPVINTLKNGGLVFAYYPQHKWLRRSRYLRA